MSVPAIIVVGPEGSGTTVLWQCITAHPDLRPLTALAAPRRGPIPAADVILHLSLPTLRPMRWVGGWAVAPGVRVVVVRRSPLHTVFSAYRRFYQRPQAAWRAYFRAVALETSWLAEHAPLCVAYEDLVHNTAGVLRRVYEFLGVDGGFTPPIALTDRNDERWREDARFAAFMQRAFGTGASHLPPADAVAPQRLDFGCHGTRITVVDASGAGIAAALRAALPPTLDPPADDPPAARYDVERRSTRAGRVAYRVVVRGEVRLRTPDAARVVDWLRAAIDATIAAQSRRALFVHAGVVAWRGHALVIPGRTRSGKSRLVTELVRCGATYYSDEFAVFDDQGRVLPYARQAMVREAGIADAIADRGAAAPLPVGLIVSTRYRDGAAWQPREVRGVRAVMPIIDNTIAARREPRRLLRLAAQLAPHAVALQGVRPDAGDVAARLLARLDDLLAGGDAAPTVGVAAGVAARAQAVLDTAPPDAVLPPRYVRIDDFLDAEAHARVLAYARSREADFAASSVVDATGVARVDADFRRSATLYDIDAIWPPIEARLRRVLPFVRRELGVAWFPPGTIERQLTVHRQGDFFGRHRDDGGTATAARRITCVYYFHGLPRRFGGGELKIYEQVVRAGRVAPGAGHVTLDASHNSAVFFASNAPHEVCPVRQDTNDFADSRFTITIWFRPGAVPAVLQTPASVAGSAAP